MSVNECQIAKQELIQLQKEKDAYFGDTVLSDQDYSTRVDADMQVMNEDMFQSNSGRNSSAAIDKVVKNANTKARKAHFLAEKNTVNRLVEIVGATQKTRAADGKPEISNFEVAKNLIDHTTTPVPLVDAMGQGVTNARFTADAVLQKYMNNIVQHIMKFGETNKGDMLKQENLMKAIFNGKSGDPDIDDLGKKIRDSIDNLNKEAANLNLTPRDLQPNINSAKINKETQTGKEIKKNGKKEMEHNDTEMRAFLIKHAENGNEWFDNFIRAKRSVTRNNVLKVKSAEDWIAINNKLGDGDFLDSLYNLFYNQSQVIGYKKLLGSNPERNIGRMADKLKLSAQQRSDLVRYAQSQTLATHGTIVSNKFTKAQQIGRQATSSSMLGTAVFTSLTDGVNISALNRLMGLDSNTIKNLTPFTQKRTREIARIFGNGIEDEFSNMMNAWGVLTNRYDDSGNILTGGKAIQTAHWMNHNVMRVFGIPMATRNFRAKAIEQYSGALGFNIREGISWDDLKNKRLKQTLQLHGIQRPQWDELMTQKHALTEEGYLDWNKLDNPDLQTSVGGFVFGAADTAVIKPGVYDDLALSLFGVHPGSQGHQTLKTVLQFIQFPVAHYRKFYEGQWKQLKSAEASNIERVMTTGYMMAHAVATGYLVANLKSLSMGIVPSIAEGDSLGEYFEENFIHPLEGGEGLYQTIKAGVIYGSIGGLAGEYIFNLTGLDNGLKRYFGMRTFEQNGMSFGPLYGTLTKTSQRAVAALFSGDLEKTGKSLGMGLLSLTPGSNWPVTKYFLREYIPYKVKEILN